MSYIFISHSSQNDFAAIALQTWLFDQGWDELFLDIDPERGIVAGERWEKALHEAANRCDAVIFLVSQNWIDSPWCRKEFRIAHRLNKRIIAVLIEDMDVSSLPEELTSTWQLTDLFNGHEYEFFQVVHPRTGTEQNIKFSGSGLKRLKFGLVKAGLDPQFFEWPPSSEPNRSPYRGMLPLEAADAGIFFGREAPTIEFIAQLRGLRESQKTRLTVILGASGSGKSSFLRAGILPRLTRDDRHFLPLPIVRPEEAIIEGDNGLLNSLLHAFKCAGLKVNRDILRKLINDDVDNLIKQLQVLINTSTVIPPPGEPVETPLLVLPIDQSEELFLTAGASESALFLSVLQKLVTHKELPLLVMFTIRSDSYDYLQSTKALIGLPQHTFSLMPVPTGAYRDVIEGPAKRLKDINRVLAIDPALTERLMNDIEEGGSKDALPLLAFTLERLYIEYGEDGDLTLDEYESMRGIEGALDVAVEQAFKEAENDPRLPTDRQSLSSLLRRGLIPWLAGIDPITQAPKRRVAKLSEIPVEVKPMVELLIKQRLLATDTDIHQETTIEPAHEALLRQWGLLKGWLKEDFFVLTSVENLQSASRDWEANNRDKQWLTHRAGRLEDAEQLKGNENLTRLFNHSDWDYLVACRKVQDRQRNKELEDAKRLADSEKKAIEERNKAQEELINSNHNMGLVLLERAKKALEQKIYSAAAYYSAQSFLKLKPNHRPKCNLIWLESINRPSLGWSTPQNNVHKSSVFKLAYSPDETKLISQERHDNFYLWNVKSGQLIKSLNRGGSSGFAFSPDSKVIATSDHRYNIHLSDTTSGDLIFTLKGHTADISCIAYSPDGLKIISGSWDSTIRVWDAHSLKLVAVLKEHTMPVMDASFSPDGLTIISAGSDHTIRLWDSIELKLINSLDGHSQIINEVAFSPDGKKITSLHEDNIVRLWNAKNLELVQTIDNAPIICMSFSLDSQILITGEENGCVNFWDTESGDRIWKGEHSTLKLGEYSQPTQCVAFSPDGKAFASGTTTLYLWNVLNGELISTFECNDNLINCITFSADSQTITLGLDDGTIRFWDVRSQHPISVPQGHSQKVTQVDYSSDGSNIISQDEEERIYQWDLKCVYPTQENEEQTKIEASTKPFLSTNEEVKVGGILSNKLQSWNTIPNDFISMIKENTHERLEVAYSPDKNIIASYNSLHGIRLWRIDTRQIITTLDSFHPYIMGAGSMVFSPNGSILATLDITDSGQNAVHLWNSTTGQTIAILDNDAGVDTYMHSLVFSPDGGTLVAIGVDCNAYLWSIRHLELIAVLEGKITCVTYSPDNKTIATGNSNNMVQIWDAVSGNIIKTLEDHINTVSCITYSPDGHVIASGSDDNTINLWHVTSGKLIATLKGHEDSVSSLAYSPDGKTIVSGSTDKTVILWENTPNKQNKIYEDYFLKFSNFTISPDGQTIATVNSDFSISVWDTSTAQIIKSLAGDIEETTRVEFSPNGKTLVSFVEAIEFQLWDLLTGEPILIMNNKINDGSFVYSPKGNTLLTLIDKKISLWDTCSYKLIKSLEININKYKCLAYSAQNQPIIGFGKNVYTWDINTNKLITILSGFKDPVYNVSYSPNGRMVYCYVNGHQGASLCDATSGESIATFKGVNYHNNVSFSPDSKYLLMHTDYSIHIRSANSGELITTIDNHLHFICDLISSSDGLTILSRDVYGTVNIWDAETFELISSIEDEIESVSFSPNGKSIAFGKQNFILFIDIDEISELNNLTYRGQWLRDFEQKTKYKMEDATAKIINTPTLYGT